jgi:hypothetical protein
MKKQKKIRSVFTSGMNLAGAAHAPKRGKGSYSRRVKHKKRGGDIFS